jgi:hypothetical protein
MQLNTICKRQERCNYNVLVVYFSTIENDEKFADRKGFCTNYRDCHKNNQIPRLIACQ